MGFYLSNIFLQFYNELESQRFPSTQSFLVSQDRGQSGSWGWFMAGLSQGTIAQPPYPGF
jgi:hypothetical protein